MNRKVYLAGPITGTSYEESTGWRSIIKTRLTELNLDGYSPMRGKAYLSAEEKLADSYSDKTMSSINGINVRDRNDVRTSAAILVNLLGAKKVSIGTVIEIAIAFEHNIPVVLVMEKDGNPHEHGMLTWGCIRVESLDEGLKCLTQLLLP